MIIDGGVTTPKGFEGAAVEAGIKYENRTDMAMIYSKRSAVTAGVFTRNLVKAAPVLWDKKIVDAKKPCRVIICNSGIANACTGEEGMNCCSETAKEASKLLDILPEEVLVSSTGVIGMQLPTQRLCEGVKKLVPVLSDAREAGSEVAKAIMTTDTQKKEIAVSTNIGGREVVIGGCCKGSGMIHPDMCTMLCFITTDAAITHAMLSKALSCSVDKSFNMVSVDGDTSTNDTVLIMANGMAENDEIKSEGSDYDAFCLALNIVTTHLARQIAADGEGATTLIEVSIKGAKTYEDASKLAKSVVTSNLTKAAIYGNDANWGRIVCALGYAGAYFDPDKIDLMFKNNTGNINIIKDGKVLDYNEEIASGILSGSEVIIEVDLHLGLESAKAWGCDLTYDYVKINADYRS